MTLVVARVQDGRIAVAADTLISAHGAAMPMKEWALKSICLPANVCVSYSGSPELAARDFKRFWDQNPQGTSIERTIEFFEQSSLTTGNDYIIAFAETVELVTIRDGRRLDWVSNTHWIGDKLAYDRFRKYEIQRGQTYEQGRAVNAVLFADEVTGSPASNLYSTMRNVVSDPEVPSVAGFVSVLSTRDTGFRHSVYSDILLDWPSELDAAEILKLTDKFDLRTSGENDGVSISQISAGYYNSNTVAFYLLKGRLLVIFWPDKDLRTSCIVCRDVEPTQIAATLDERLGFPFRALCWVFSAPEGISLPFERRNPDHGVSMALRCEVNTMPRTEAPI